MHSEPYRRLAREATQERLLAEPLQDLISAEGAVVKQILTALLGSGMNLAKCIGLTNSYGHAALHTAAEGGNVAFIEGVTAAAAAADTLTAEDAAQLGRAIEKTLGLRDSMGRTPFHYAAMYGTAGTEDPDMRVFSGLEALAATTPALGGPAVDMAAVCAPDKHGRDCDAYSASRQPLAQQQPSDGRSKKAKKNGGWALSRYGDELYGTERCDVDEIIVEAKWKLRDLNAALAPYIATSKPVVVRGGVRLLKGLTAALTKSSLVKAFGKRSATVGPIPYADTFELETVRARSRQPRLGPWACLTCLLVSPLEDDAAERVHRVVRGRCCQRRRPCICRSRAGRGGGGEAADVPVQQAVPR